VEDINEDEMFGPCGGQLRGQKCVQSLMWKSQTKITLIRPRSGWRGYI